MAIMKKKATRESNEGEPVGKKRAKLPDAVSDEPKLTKKAVKDAKPGATKKPWKPFKKAEKKKPEILTSKESHAKAKALRQKRRESDRSHYDIGVDIKKIWEELRQENVDKAERTKMCRQILDMVRGKEHDFVFAHDTTRVFQSLVKYAPVKMRSELFNSVRKYVLEMVKSKYSVFFVRALLRRGTKEEKDYIIGLLMPNARKLITNRIAGPVVEFAYNEYASAKQRLSFSQSFYGPSFSLLEEEGQQTLAKVLEEQPLKKPYILQYMKQCLDNLVEKECLSYTFVHRLLMEYFTYSDNLHRQMMAESIQEQIPHILHTRDGARASMYAVWYSSAKGRKTIIKALKPFLDKALCEEYGHAVVIALLDSVDDTKILSRLILSHITESLSVLADDKWGRHVLHYLLKPRDTSFFNKEVRALLAEGDENPYSKKEKAVRSEEILTEVSPSMISYAAENLEHLLTSSNAHKLLLQSIIQHAVGGMSPVWKALAAEYSEPYKAGDATHILENKALGFITRKLMSSNSEHAACMIESLSKETVDALTKTDNGCFFIGNLLKGAEGDNKERLVKSLTKHKTRLSKSKDNKAHKFLLDRLATT